MTAKVQLVVRWDGDVPGLAAHRLDLDSFLDAIVKLNKALKWVASSMVAEADDPDYGIRGGRKKGRARELKVQWSSLEDGCVTSRFDVAMSGQQDAFEDLPRRTVTRFIEHVKAEAAGRPHSGVVRRYLQALPSQGLVQTYSATVDGREVARADLGTLRLAAPPPPPPTLRRGRAEIIGAYFEPGQPALVLRTEGHVERLTATEALVERGLSLRDQPVRFVALGVPGGADRLIRLAPSGAALPDPGATNRHIAHRWRAVLDRLGAGPE